VEDSNIKPKIIRAGMQAVGGIVPIAGGFISAAAGAWSEHEQDKVNNFFKSWIKMLEDEIREKEKTIIEIMMRLDVHDAEIAKRLESKGYQSLLKKTFREWSGAESEEKRTLIRNILSNAAAANFVSDDVIKMFIDWINTYSEMHFQVIGAVYNNNGITRGGIWKKIGKLSTREDTADADLYKLLIRDLSMGEIIRQHREVDYYGNYIKKPYVKSDSKETVSAFDENEQYELTSLGRQFVHYAMTDLPIKIGYEAKSGK
jgi:hypothetical protein